MIRIKAKGNFSKSYKFFEKCKNLVHLGDFDKYGKMGVEALKAATPIDSGNTANSWDYTIKNNRSGIAITWTNSNVNDGVPVAILVQYGHATGTGGYVSGIDYINPALKPVFDHISEEIWEELQR